MNETQFWNNVMKGPSDICWPWMRARVKHKLDYGNAWYLGRHHRAHRLAWMFVNGPIPDGLDILHKCDNPPCCNPNHLYPGTDKENQRDARERGRLGQLKGESHGRAILTVDQIVKIREEFAAGNIRTAELGKRYNVSGNNIARICRGDLWKDAGGPIQTNIRKWFTPEQVAKIREMKKEGLHTQREIAEIFNTDQGVISRIIRREVHTAI